MSVVKLGTQNIVLSIIRNNIDSKNFCNLSLDSNLNDIGITSIKFIKVVVEIEEKFGFEFDDNMLLATNFNTVKSMMDYIEFKLKELNINNDNS